MNETGTKIFDMNVLQKRIAVSDRKLAFMLGVCDWIFEEPRKGDCNFFTRAV